MSSNTCRTLAIMLGLVLSGAVTAQDRPDRPQEIPWAVRLGLRVAAIQKQIPTVDQVVLVPDEQTYLAELGKWSPAGRWPVLFEDDVYAPLFIRGFKPAAVIRRPSIRTGADGDAIEATEVEAVVIHAFGGDPDVHDLNTVFKAQLYESPGVVVTSLSDSAWPAAVALAAGHGQALVWVDGGLGQPNNRLNDATARRTRSTIQDAIQAAGIDFGELGSGPDTITICRRMGGKARVELPASQKVPIQGGDRSGPIAMTDFIGRSDSGDIFAFVGWIWGDEIRSTYMAMSSLFLKRDEALLYNSYQESGQWGVFSMSETSRFLRDLDMEVTYVPGKEATPVGWQRMIRRGLSSGVMLLNSKGNAEWFQLRGGPVDALDVPVLHEPLALQMVHSWSLTAPDASGTIGERWLRNGVYAYVGSAHEPTLGAFVPPDPLARRSASGVPFLIAARHWQGPFVAPWRVQTIGDPLMLWLAPKHVTWSRLASTDDGPGELLRTGLPDLMRDGVSDPGGASLVEALRRLYMLGEEGVASGLWKNVSGSSPSSRAARAALPSLFMSGTRDDVMSAYQMLDETDVLAQDMLWQRWQTVLPDQHDDMSVATLLGAIRADWPHADIKRLAPAIERTFGRGRVAQEIDRWLERDLPENRKKALRELRASYR